MSRETEYPEWSRIPVPLQHQFFSHARKEALTCKKKLMEQGEKLQRFRKHLKFQKVPDDDQWKNWRIACVDGSYSPATSERIGARYGAYCGGYFIFEGDELVDEGHSSGTISQDQIGDPERAMLILRLLCTNLERDIAVRCLNHENVDLLIIDGSFFGFRVKCSEIRNQEINVEGFKKGGDLVDHVRDKSIELMNSRKAVGIIKRVRTTAFDGWTIYEHGSEKNSTGRNDRAILASIMPQNCWFAYEWLLGSPGAFNYFTGFREAYRRLTNRRRFKSMDSIFRETSRLADRNLMRNLNCAPGDIFQTSRYYIRCTNSAAPFCFEVNKDMNIKPLLAYFEANYNPVTGLPFPIDLIDENVSLPRGFTKEFVEEVEALLIQDKALDKLDLSNYFMYLNPQKEE